MQYKNNKPKVDENGLTHFTMILIGFFKRAVLA